MKTPKIAEAIGGIDPKLVDGAIVYMGAGKRKPLIKWISVAACFMVTVMTVALLLPLFGGGGAVTIGGVERSYKAMIGGSEGVIEFPWEYKLPYERFGSVRHDGREYRARGRAIDERLLGEALGTCSAKGVDVYTDTVYTEDFTARSIRGVSAENLIAVCMDGTYYVYFNSQAAHPATFGELMAAYSLFETLPLASFSVNEGYKEKGNYRIADDSYLWQILSECEDASLYAEGNAWSREDRRYLSFTATSEALGVYKKVFYVTEDGYISTNIFGSSCVYSIGEEAAGKLIASAKSNGVETPWEQSEYTVGGTVTEIGDGYILLDDTVLCRNKRDGMVFKILTDQPIIGRYLVCADIKVGDTVSVKFQGEIVLEEGNTISGATSMHKGRVVGRGMEIPE